MFGKFYAMLLRKHLKRRLILRGHVSRPLSYGEFLNLLSPLVAPSIPAAFQEHLEHFDG